MSADPSEVTALHAVGEVGAYQLQTDGTASRTRRRTRLVKRLFDVLSCSAAIVILSPVFVVIAVAIKIGGRGPVFFRQVRIGLHGKPFVIWKFRTMTPKADRIAPNVSPTSDPRVTRVGRILRRTYLDELPQIFNVIAGSMSVVGPRPETPEFVALYTAEERKVLGVRPGLVGPSTLASMDESAILEAADDPYAHYVDVLMRERVRLDLGYLDRMSFGADVRLLVHQASKILLGRG